MTACELDYREDEMARLQREDAIDSLRKLDKGKISLRIPGYHGYALILLTLALVLVQFIPNPMDHLIREREELRAELQEQMEELKKLKDESAALAALTEEQRQELAALVRELGEELKNTGDYKEALKDISKAEEKLTALTDRIREENLGGLASQLESLEETQSLAAALSGRNLSDLETALEG